MSDPVGHIDVECTRCRVPMNEHLGSGGQIRYYRCPSCQRWVSSTYAEIFRADAGFRPRPRTEETPEAAHFEDVKGKLERWLASVDDRDPYRALGVSPLDPDDQVRQRFRDLAMAHHPDRGGSPDRMREINLAYERILRHRAARRAEADAARVPVLPARSR
jgi:hypothetical protein